MSLSVTVVWSYPWWLVVVSNSTVAAAQLKPCLPIEGIPVSIQLPYVSYHVPTKWWGSDTVSLLFILVCVPMMSMIGEECVISELSYLTFIMSGFWCAVGWFTCWILAMSCSAIYVVDWDMCHGPEARAFSYVQWNTCQYSRTAWFQLIHSTCRCSSRQSEQPGIWVTRVSQPLMG